MKAKQINSPLLKTHFAFFLLMMLLLLLPAYKKAFAQETGKVKLAGEDSMILLAENQKLHEQVVDFVTQGYGFWFDLKMYIP